MTTPPLNLRPLTPPPADDAASPSSSSFSYEASPQLYLFTSLTAGSSHIITATSRMETILKANRIPFKAVDCATDEKARRIWSRRAGRRKLPGLVKMGNILADLELVEEWNEFGEIKDHLGGDPLPTKQPPPTQPAESVQKEAAAAGAAKADIPAAVPTESKTGTTQTSGTSSSVSLHMSHQQQLARQVAAIAAQRGKPKRNISPVADPKASKDSTGPTDAVEEPGTAAPTAPKSPPRSPELDQDRDIDDKTHNTSSSTALPALSVQTHSAPHTSSSNEPGSEVRPRADTTSSVRSMQSPNVPNPPPPTATEIHAPASQLSPAMDDIPEGETPREEAGDPAASAGPAAASGLAAVTSSNDPSAEQDLIHKRSRGSSFSAAPPEEIAAIEKRDSIPEAAAEDEVDTDPTTAGEPLEDEKKLTHHQSPVNVAYGDGYDREIDEDEAEEVDDEEDEDDNDEEDDEDEDDTADGQVNPTGKVEGEEGDISPRILMNDPTKHIKFSGFEPEAIPSGLGNEVQSNDKEAAADPTAAGKSVDD